MSSAVAITRVTVRRYLVCVGRAIMALSAGACIAAAAETSQGCTLVPVQFSMGRKVPAGPGGAQRRDKDKQLAEALKRLSPKEQKQVAKEMKRLSPEKRKLVTEALKRRLLGPKQPPPAQKHARSGFTPRRTTEPRP